MKEVKAPEPYDKTGSIVLFEAGSIEMGKASPWQSRLTEALSEFDNLLILNPRRNDWDSSWKQEKDDPQFREQVLWELHGQEISAVIAMYFDPATKSPITLLELGLFASDKLVVFCPEGFYRKGNVDIVCERYGIAQATSWDDFVMQIKKKIQDKENKTLAGLW